MADLNFPKDRTELVPPGTGSLQTGDTYTANGQTWVYDATVGAWGSGGGESSGDIFLSKINDDTAAGEITFEKLTTHEDGVKVTGGTSDPADGVSQISARSLDGSLTFLSATNNGQFLCFNAAGLYSEGVSNRAGSAVGGLRTDVHYTENNSSTVSFSDVADYGDVKGNAFKRSFYATPRNLSFTAEDTQNYIAFYANVAADSTSGKNLAWGFYANTAPNFFAGNTYIGGGTSRSTRELWESTLTEEQKEQLEAGTLAAPANVSTPGDGSFARQWWYDQQTAEDQALIDSGELQYPEHLQAANFVDTFALGDNTKIDLLSTGEAHFANNVGIGTKDPQAKLDVSGGGLTVQHTSGNLITLKTSVNNTNDSKFLFQKARGGTGAIAVVQDGDDLGTLSWSGYYGGAYQTNSSIRAEADIAGSYGDRLLYDSDTHLIRTNNTTRLTIANGGNVGIGTTDPQATLDVSGDITCSGLINGAFSLRMETDDPAAFQTTYATDEEGNQVENQTYVGTTEDLLSIIKDLRARVAALESA